MKETLHDAFGRDQTRIKRAFRWVVTFRDFPAGSRQTVDGDSMMTEALTLFTKGRAEFYLDGERRGDRVPGVLSTEHDLVGQGGEFELRYVEPTTRVCIPLKANAGRLPTVKKWFYDHQGQGPVLPGQKFMVCLGTATINGKTFSEEQSFQIGDTPVIMDWSANTLLLEFL
jgi:hypothetical protein